MNTLDAQRYAKLRALTNAAKRMGHEIKMDLEDLDREIDSIDLSVLREVEALHDFAEFVTLVLNDVSAGFKEAYCMGGTGIYRDGFYWRCLRELSRAERRTVVQLVDYVLQRPEYASIATLVGRPFLDEDHDEDISVGLRFSSAESKHLDEIKGAVASLLFGDLVIMTQQS